jgi:hypothetical protein
MEFLLSSNAFHSTARHAALEAAAKYSVLLMTQLSSASMEISWSACGGLGAEGWRQ